MVRAGLLQDVEHTAALDVECVSSNPIAPCVNLITGDLTGDRRATIAVAAARLPVLPMSRRI
jgi:hypothetical protein